MVNLLAVPVEPEPLKTDLFNVPIGTLMSVVPLAKSTTQVASLIFPVKLIVPSAAHTDVAEKRAVAVNVVSRSNFFIVTIP
jgi:hypothetical protein